MADFFLFMDDNSSFKKKGNKCQFLFLITPTVSSCNSFSITFRDSPGEPFSVGPPGAASSPRGLSPPVGCRSFDPWFALHYLHLRLLLAQYLPPLMLLFIFCESPFHHLVSATLTLLLSNRLLNGHWHWHFFLPLAEESCLLLPKRLHCLDWSVSNMVSNRTLCCGLTKPVLGSRTNATFLPCSGEGPTYIPTWALSFHLQWLLPCCNRFTNT